MCVGGGGVWMCMHVIVCTRVWVCAHVCGGHVTHFNEVLKCCNAYKCWTVHYVCKL